MEKWTGTTGGEYLQVRDLNELANWYSSLSKKLTFRASNDALKDGGPKTG